MSSSDSENKYTQQRKPSISDKRQRMSGTTVHSLSVDQPTNRSEQQPVNVGQQTTLAGAPLQTLDQMFPQEMIETNVEQLSTDPVSPVNKSFREIVQEYHVPTTDEIKPATQQTSVKEVVPSPITTTITTTTTTRKSALTEEEDDDGFRVVRYRKHTPSSPTTPVVASNQQSFSSGVDRRSFNIPRKQSSSPATSTPKSTLSQTTIPKKRPPRPKKSREETLTFHGAKSVDTLSSSTTDTDFASSSIEDFKNQFTTRSSEPIIESSVITEDISSPHSETEVTTPTTKYEIEPTNVNEPVLTTNLTETVQQPLVDIKNEEQPATSTTSPTVTSADTSEDAAKKPKKKHKRIKREPGESELSTPSDEVPSTTETLSTTKTTSISSPTEAPVSELPSTSSQVVDTSDKITTNEETVPSSSSIEPKTNVEDEEVQTTSSKKSSKRRKKKAQSTEKQSEDENVLDSSTTSTTDKDSSSTSTTQPVKQTSLDVTSKPPLISEEGTQESEWTTVKYNKRKSKTPEQEVVPSSQSSAQSIPSNIVPEKVTDVEFKFTKGGELTMTSPASIKHTPAEWGTVRFLSEERDLSSTDKLESPTEQTDTPQTASEKEPIDEPTTDLSSNITTKMETETSSKSLESSETSGEGDLDAYRDQTGRLRRKKPRKQTSNSTQLDDTSSLSTIEQPTAEEHILDQQSIKEHWADVLATPLPQSDEEQKPQSEFIQEEQSVEDEDSSETSSKLDTFLPDYIRQQIKSTSSPRSLSFNDDRFKSSSKGLFTSRPSLHSTHTVPLSSSNRSASADTSENEGRKQLEGSPDQQLYSRENSDLQSTTTNQTENDTGSIPSSSSTENTIRKKKQRPKMLRKDVEAKSLLTHEFDDTPLTVTQTQQASPVKQITEDKTEEDESFLSSVRHQFSSAISNISDSLTTALSSMKTATTDEQVSPQSDEPVPSIDEVSATSPVIPSESTTTAKRPSTRSPRKRSKRDSGPDYENVTLQSSGDNEPTSVDQTPSEAIKVETHKQQSRQRTSSGRHVSNTEEENEQQAVLADDEGDEDLTSKPSPSYGTVSDTNIQTSSDSSSDKQDSSSTAIPKRRRQKKKSTTEEVESVTDVSTNVSKPDQEETTSDHQSTVNEPLRPVQGFHSFTPNKYQYNQYEEATTVPSESSQPLVTEPDSTDEVLSRGLNLWLQEKKDDEPGPSEKKDEVEKSTGATGLTRAMQSLIIQPVESENEDEEEDDSWNGPRAKKPTYTTGIRVEKRIHTSSGYNINHPRSTILKPSWLISPSTDKDDEEDDSIDDTSDKQQLPHTVDTQASTMEERQTHLNNLADLNFQGTTSNLSSSSSSLSSAAKWNETSIRSDDNSQQQTSFTEDDVQRCLGEDFYRESLAPSIVPPEQRTLTSLNELVLKPSQLPEDIDDDDNDLQKIEIIVIIIQHLISMNGHIFLNDKIINKHFLHQHQI